MTLWMKKSFERNKNIPEKKLLENEKKIFAGKKRTYLREREENILEKRPEGLRGYAGTRSVKAGALDIRQA